MSKINITEFKGTSKKTGKEFTCLQLRVGEYTTLLFPTPIERQYILDIVKREQREEFAEGLENE
jgi:hypothetical protein